MGDADFTALFGSALQLLLVGLAGWVAKELFSLVIEIRRLIPAVKSLTDKMEEHDKEIPSIKGRLDLHDFRIRSLEKETGHGGL